MDNPPPPGQADMVAAHHRWRAAVEADEDRMLQASFSGPLWHAIPLPDDVHVIPVYGGTESAIEQVVTTLVTSGLEAGMANSRIVNLSGWSLTKSLKKQMSTAKKNRAQFERIGPRGSTVNLFGNPNTSGLIALLVDALRISADRGAGRQTQQERQELGGVVRQLRGQITLHRIIDAVDVALGSTTTPVSLTVDEVRDLRDYFAGTVSQRRATADRLTDLHVDLQVLRSFGQDPSRSPEVAGAGKLTIRWFDVEPGNSADESELGRQLAARAVLQTFSLQSTDELLVIVGAERLSDEVRDEMVSASQRLGKRLALLYTQINDAGQRLLGYAGSSVAIFLKMPNPNDATVASEYLGREYKFVVNGISIAEGQTEDWSNAYGTSASQGRSSSTTSSRSSGFGGGAFDFNRTVGSSVTRSFERGTSQTRSQGGSSSSTKTTSTGRVQEYVIEPDVFQKMPDDLMMIIGKDTVLVASNQNSIRFSKQISDQYLTVS